MRNRPAVFKRSRGFRLTPPIALAALAAVMALVAGGLYVMDPGSAPSGGGVPRAPVPPGLPYPEVPRVSVEEAKALLDAHGVIFLDVRGPAEYGLGHIPARS
jgi:hypothetical protein